MLCLCAAQLKFWFRRWKFSQPLRAGKTDTFHFSHHSHALITLYVQFLCSDWSKFDRWVHVENLCIILKLVSFDSWSWPSFVSTCDVFNCLFSLDVQNEILLLSRVFCYSWLVCLLRFWLRNASLVKVGNPGAGREKRKRLPENTVKMRNTPWLDARDRSSGNE